MTVENALYAECGACQHVWPVVYLPMELRKAATVAKRAACAKCGETKKVYCASEAGMQRYYEARRA
jgi:hypothetical protein